MKTIGLVGGVASGKSRVAEMLVELGAGLLDADRTGHQVLATDPEVREAIQRRWGPAILRPDGMPDRTAIARQVFGSGPNAASDRAFLEELLHPRIHERLEAERAHYAKEMRLATVLDAPLLLEAGWATLCNVVVMIEASREVRLARAGKRGWSEAEFAQREAAQWSVERKRQEADVTIENEGSESTLREAVEAFWRKYIVR